MKKHHNKNGFTLVEMLVAIAIGIVVSFVLVVAVINGLERVRIIKQKEKIEAEANFIIEKMAYWIRQGKILIVDGAGQKLDIVFPEELNLSTKSFQIIEESGNGVIQLIDVFGGEPSNLNSNNVQVLTNPAVSYFTAMGLPDKISSIRVNLGFSTSDIDSFPVTVTLTKRNK